MKTDSQIANEATLLPIAEIAAKLSLTDAQYEPYGRYIAKVSRSVMDEQKISGSRLILVTSISPTKAGIGKTTVSVGLNMGLNRLGKRAVVVLREPSLGPCFGMKGGACGGGYAQVLPMDKINLHFTGDFHAITSAHNMITALMDNYLYQKHLTLKQTVWKRVLDVNDRALREIITGLGPSVNGGLHNSGFDITPASEIMAIFCLSRDLNDLRERLDNILLGVYEDGTELYLRELGVTGSILALLKDAFNPNLVQTLEGYPAIIHGGPFANIAHGCNSIVATRTGLSLADYVITEAGFGSDLGAEKFYDIKTRVLGKTPALTVLVATIRGLRNQAPDTTDALAQMNIGLAHLGRHIANLRRFGQKVVVAVNRFLDDSDEDIALLTDYCHQAGVDVAVNTAFFDGAKGAEMLAQTVLDALDKPSQDFHYTYELTDSLRTKVEKVVRNVYGGGKVIYSALAEKRLAELEKRYGQLPICIAKTQYSFTDDQKIVGTPSDFDFHVRDVILNRGAGFVVVIAGDMMRMPGLPKMPAALLIDVDPSGRITGLS